MLQQSFKVVSRRRKLDAFLGARLLLLNFSLHDAARLPRLFPPELGPDAGAPHTPSLEILLAQLEGRQLQVWVRVSEGGGIEVHRVRF